MYESREYTLGNSDIWGTFCMSANDYEGITSIDFEVTSKLQQINEFENTKSTNNENKLCVCVSVNARILGLFNQK